MTFQPTPDPDNPDRWLDWVDAFGHRIARGDLAIAAHTVGRGAGLSLIQIERINRVDSKGREHKQTRREWVGPPRDSFPSAQDFYVFQRQNPHHYKRETFDRATVTGFVLLMGSGGWEDDLLYILSGIKTPRRQTYQTPGKIVRYEPPPDVAAFINRMALV